MSQSSSTHSSFFKSFKSEVVPTSIAIIKVIGDIGVVPGLAIVANALELIYNSVEEVKLHRELCAVLANECTSTIQAILDHKGTGTNKIKTCVDDTIGIITEISVQLSQWKSYGKFRSWYEREEIADEIEGYRNQLMHIVQLLGITLALNTNTMVQEIIKREAENEDKLTECQTRFDYKVTLLQKQLQGSPEGTPQHSSALQQMAEIRNPTDSGAKEFPLPPADLLGECSRLNDLVFSGSSFDVYQGLRFGSVVVAMKLVRSEAVLSEPRLQRQINIWRTLQHPHVLKWFGYTTSATNQTYLVSPWLNNRDVIRYLERRPDANRFQIICDIAEGTAYLHSVGIFHGGLKGSNILIDDEGRGVVSDFVLTRELRENGNALVSQPSSDDAYRYQARELSNDGISTKKSDVYAWAMTSLEIMTGIKPFASVRLAVQILMKNIRISRSDYRVPILTQYKELWPLFESCWKDDPAERPDMDEVIARLMAMAPQDGAGA